MCWFGLAGLVSGIAGAGHRWPVPAQAAAALYPGSVSLQAEGTMSPYLVPGQTCKESYAAAEICTLLLCLWADVCLLPMHEYASAPTHAAIPHRLAWTEGFQFL